MCWNGGFAGRVHGVIAALLVLVVLFAPAGPTGVRQPGA